MIKKILHIALAAALFTGCTERVDVELDSTYTRLVVDGTISSDTGVHQVTLTTSADYFSNTPVPKVTEAMVMVTDGDNLFPLQETIPGVSGIYSTGEGFQAEIGKNYSLVIELKEPIAGKSSFEASSVLNRVTTLDSIAAMFHPDWGPEGIWTIKLWAQEPGNEVNYYMFNLYRNGILITDTITKKVVSDDKFYNGSYMKGVDVMYINHKDKWETIFPGDTIILQMSGITKEYYDFIDQVRQSGFSIPFFSGPPANVKGNVSNGAVGFFAAYSSSFARNVVPAYKK